MRCRRDRTDRGIDEDALGEQAPVHIDEALSQKRDRSDCDHGRADLVASARMTHTCDRHHDERDAADDKGHAASETGPRERLQQRVVRRIGDVRWVLRDLFEQTKGASPPAVPRLSTKAIPRGCPPMVTEIRADANTNTSLAHGARKASANRTDCSTWAACPHDKPDHQDDHAAKCDQQRAA